MLVKWIRCTVVDRRGFERGSESGRGFPGSRVSGGRGRLEPWPARCGARVRLLESRAFYDSFMARSHDRLASAQAGTFKDAQVRLFDYRFDVKTGFEPRFTDADLLRVALCRVHEERAEHYVLMQEKVWNPAMAGSPAWSGAVRRGPGERVPGAVHVAVGRRTRQVPHRTGRAARPAGADRGRHRGADGGHRATGAFLDRLRPRTGTRHGCRGRPDGRRRPDGRGDRVTYAVRGPSECLVPPGPI
ncbi:DUF4937 domain-containing protein [Streptomyces sp. SHP22-7]|nr:DUF4937 domain-containing protein [Streptomyces sp. SHP22-7]